MIRPLVTLKSRSCVMRLLSRPLQLASRLVHRRRVLVARDHLVDAKKVFRIVLALGLRLADESRGHQLMIALAIVAFVRLEPNLGRQYEIAKRLGELQRIERLLLVGDAYDRLHRRIAEPVARRRNLAVIHLTDVGDELIDARDAWLFPIPLEHPDADPR